MRTVAALALFVASGACGDNGGATCSDTDRVCNGTLRDAEGRTLILRGVNLAGAHKIAPYTDTFTEADYAQLHAWGFRAVRFLIPWAGIEPTEGSYDDAYLDWVASRMQWANAAGLSVILDMHQDVYGEGFLGFNGAPRWTCDESYYAAFVPQDPWVLNYTDPNVLACFDHLWSTPALQTKYAQMWGHVAQRLASEPAIIGFDPMNEPYWGTYSVANFERDRLQPFYLEVIASVRAHAPTWTAFAEPAASRNLGFATKLDPFEVPNVVYAPHMYDPNAELDGTFSEERREALLSTAADLRADADRLGIPLWIGEYGGIGASPTITAYMDAAYDGMAAAHASGMYWAMDKGGGYALFDAQGVPIPQLVDAIVRPYPERVAGELTSWSYDDQTRTLRVEWKPDPSITAPTILVLPAHVYPNGASIECAGCTLEKIGGEARITSTASTQIATVAPD